MHQQENNTVWLIDPVHTRIRFETKYLLITTVSGWFSEFEGTVITGSDDFNDSRIDLTLYTHSVFTGNEQRDNHLRSTDFLDSKNFPIISFKSASIHVSGPELDVIGDLYIKGITETIQFKARHTGSMQDPSGNLKAGFEMHTTINRKDFGVSWNQTFDQAGVLLGDEVRIIADVQLLKVR